MPALIELSNVEVKSKQRQILQNVDLQIHANQIVTIIGPNGAGKTTLLKIVAGLKLPTSGSVKKQANLRISYVPQNFVLPQSMPMTIADFLASHINRSSLSQKQAMSSAGLGLELSQSVHSLSGGELQKLLLARALLTDPQLLILDEPAQGYDHVVQAAFYRTLQKLRTSLECSILIVSHDLHLVMSATDHVICLNTHICCEGEPNDISRAPEYRALFGENGLSNEFAVYQHDHDHEHNADGEIIHKHD